MKTCKEDSIEYRIHELINRMNNLREGEDAVGLLAACGKKAIPALQKYLMEGKPSHIYQPRQRAVNVLAKLGARKALLEYLAMPNEIADPVIRFGEEAVQSTAARALAKWRTNDVYERLTTIARLRNLPGVIETLGLFCRVETIPLFVAALGDDICNTEAENALLRIGKRTKPALIGASRIDAGGSGESPSNLMLRRNAVRILSQLSVSPEEWRTLRKLLEDDDLDIAVTASRVAMDVAIGEDKNVALNKLFEAIPGVDWFVLTEIEVCIMKHYDFARGAVEREIADLRERLSEERAEDRMLQVLEHIQKKMGSSSQAV